MQQKGDLEKYLKISLDHSIEMKMPGTQESLFDEEMFELKKYNAKEPSRMVMLGVDYGTGEIASAEACFYPAQFDTARAGVQEYAALAIVERVLAPYQAELVEDLDQKYIMASGEEVAFVKKAVECINAFLK